MCAGFCDSACLCECLGDVTVFVCTTLSRVPRELGTGDKSISMVDKRGEEYVPPPPPAYVAFGGDGRSLA